MLKGNDTRHVPLGDSGVAAIVVSSLYLLGAAAIIANWQKTGFHYYKALISSAILRSVAFAVRAVYLLGAFRPPLVGVFMALSNSGWGANVSAMCLVTACWAEHSKTKFHPVEHAVYKKGFYFWVVVLVLLGPSVGFLAAGLLYGTVSGRAEAVGQTLQAVASWAIVVVSGVLWFLLCRIAGTALLAESSDHEHLAEEKRKRLLGDPAGHTDKPTRSENLMGILWVCATLGLFRSIMGVLCTFPKTKFMYSDDWYYYPLFQLPELLILAVCATPTLLARISLVYPSPDSIPDPDDLEASASDPPESE